MPRDNTPIFLTLEPPKTPWTRWVTSVFIHAAVIALMIMIPVAVHQSIKPQTNQTLLVDPPKPLTPPPPMRIQAPKPIPAPKVAFKEPNIKPPEIKKAVIPPPVIEPPKKVELPKIEAPKVEVARVPQPKFEAPVPTPAKPAPPRPAVKTDVFAANAPTPEGPKSAAQVKMGGFGDPNGVPASATSTGKGLTVAKVGSFEMPVGSGNGGGGGRGHVVASAGFGSSGAPGTPGYGSAGPRGLVQAAGFSDAKVAGPAAQRVAKAAAPAVTPVEILKKPKPVYTAEALQMKLEGEVLLEVDFTSDGRVRVLRVVKGLGHGLDESARNAASNIQFRPSTSSGVPVDTRGIVHIVFELS